jgi:hypothetical protein
MTQGKFILMIGRQGGGKTLMMTKIAVNEYNECKRFILSNYTLFGIPFTLIDKETFKNLITSDELIKEYTIYNRQKGVLQTINIYDDYVNCTGLIPRNNMDYFINSIILIDEIHIWLDAYNFYKKDDVTISAFFSQLRKRNILLLATTQYLLNLNIRVRRQLSYVLDMSKKGKIFQCVTSEVDGYYQSVISTTNFDLREYYKYYDTKEIIHV